MGAPPQAPRARDRAAPGGGVGGRAKLQRVNLQEANLQEADLDRAELERADLEGANLQGAILTDAVGLTPGRLNLACGDDKTKLPAYFADYKMKPCPEPEQSPAD